MKKIIVFLFILFFAAGGYTMDVNGRRTYSIRELTAVVSFDPGKLEEEARMLGIPESEIKRYVIEMRQINKDYRAGALTRTEYIRVKRDVINRLK